MGPAREGNRLSVHSVVIVVLDILGSSSAVSDASGRHHMATPVSRQKVVNLEAEQTRSDGPTVTA
jgi:hypothetical protein